MHNSASANKRTNERTKKMTTTTGMTTGMTTALWFHDASADNDEQHETSYPCLECGDACRDDYCDECLLFVLLRQLENREAYEEDMKNHKYGVCMDCGRGLDYEGEFLVDRRETQCDCFTCDSCFTHFHGNDALYQAVHWKQLGNPIPQFVRLSCLTV